MARHSPQKVGIETRADKKGREHHRGVVYDKRSGRPIRGPWTQSLAAARAWRNDALDRLAKGTLSGDRGPTVRAAIKTFLRGIEEGSIHNRSRRRYKPSVVRDYKRDLGQRIDPLLGPRHLRDVQLPYAGLRAGELLALDSQHVDLELRVLRVERAWDHGSKEFIAPKSKAAKRIVPITERLWAVLSDHRETLGAGGLLLPALRGDRSRPMGHSALVKRLKKRWAEAGLEPLKLHEGRHTFASLLIAAGANAKAITTYMGHSSIQVTYDRYGHLMPGSEAEVAGLLDTYLARNAG